MVALLTRLIPTRVQSRPHPPHATVTRRCSTHPRPLAAGMPLHAQQLNDSLAAVPTSPTNFFLTPMHACPCVRVRAPGRSTSAIPGPHFCRAAVPRAVPARCRSEGSTSEGRTPLAGTPGNCGAPIVKIEDARAGGPRIWVLRFDSNGHGFQDLGSRVEVPGFGFQGFGSRVLGVPGFSDATFEGQVGTGVFVGRTDKSRPGQLPPRRSVGPRRAFRVTPAL
eukprot:357272-Chlamydomonas_euryale.AAC.10